MLCNMAATNTASLTVKVSGSTKTVTVVGGGATYFAGYLVA